MGRSRFGEGTRVLVVDDNEDMRLSMRLVLEQAGYKVELAANGREALKVQRLRPAQLLITDLFMPDTDGFETIESFRKEFPAMRIVAISGGSKDPGMRTDHLPVAREIGAHATLRKPFAIEALLKTLQSL